ncbi:hypothetical protein BKH41_06610 [Helicobacter sp. 12S02232-10]|uniref:CvpA family protein n=1 Tax=Helicobacter sp. 12S02232-10 TaxID=1476197 RepID=UPI000BA4F696|nr:CvpA family protein [Helicobacter sp. 12S02232-10]PAF47931.1 hypothetical protein BKH41_06610 [Helicobacter sp. 12S02232-10]
MSYIDLILIVIIIIIGLRGFYNGFVNEISGVLGIVLGVFFASRFASSMGNWFTTNIHNFNSVSLASLIGFVIILAVIWVTFLILGVIIGKFVKISDFAIVDKTLGFIFSCCKVFLIIGFILFGISKLNFMKELDVHMSQNSKIYGIMNTISSSVMKLQSVQETANNIKNISQPATDSAQKTIEETNQNITDSIKNSAESIYKNIPSQIKEKTQE